LTNNFVQNRLKTKVEILNPRREILNTHKMLNAEFYVEGGGIHVD